MITGTTTDKERRASRKEAQRAKVNKLRAKQGHPRMRAALGVVLDGESFTIDAFMDRMGITRDQVNELRRRAEKMGVVLARGVGSRVWILGSDYLAFLRACPEAKLESKESSLP